MLTSALRRCSSLRASLASSSTSFSSCRFIAASPVLRHDRGALATTAAVYTRVVDMPNDTTTNERDRRIIWVDCEMTGLEVETQTLVEIAVLVTNDQLEIVAEGPDIVIHQSEDVLAGMNDWCKATFAKNGLLERIRQSNVSMREAEDQVLRFLLEHTKRKTCPLAGNTVWMDRIFIKKYMPRVEEHLHYRIIDVSTVKELGFRWYPKELAGAPTKAGLHRALDDIKESIQELTFYRQRLFK